MKQESLADTDSDMPAGNRGRGSSRGSTNTEQDITGYEQVVRRAQQQRHAENSRNFSEASLRSRGLEICTRSGHLILSRDERRRMWTR